MGEVVVYAETFGTPSEVWMVRQARATGATVVTHEHLDPETFPFEPLVVVPRRPRLLDRGLRVVRWLASGHRYHLHRSTARALQEVLRERGAKVVHAHYGSAALRIAPVAARLGCRLLVTFHGFDVHMLPQRDPAYRRALAALFRQADCVIAISEFVAGRLAALGCKDARVLPIGVPVRPPRERAAHDAVRILTVARLHPVKGVPDLVDAVAAADAPVELDVVGDGPERAIVEARAAETDRVRLHGALAPAEVARLLDRADLFVLNSRTLPTGEMEGLGISVLEAMEAGLPVVATRHGGIPEAVEDGRTGILVEERDTACLTRALEELARDADRRAAMGAAGRARVEERYALVRCAERLRRIYAG
jgi:glycosyltransferase involved in cell wall biosynthesis